MAIWKGPGITTKRDKNSKAVITLKPGDDIPSDFFDKSRFDKLVGLGKIKTSKPKPQPQGDKK